MELNDGEVLKKYPKVYSLYDVMGEYPDLSINEIQLRLFANCSKYISSNGGQLILSAYFGKAEAALSLIILNTVSSSNLPVVILVA